MRTRRFAALAFLAALAFAPTANATLIGYWTFDASTGADASAYANNGTVGASVTYVPGGGWNGNTAIQTPGANVGGGAGVVTVPNSASMASINNSLTLSYWMKAPLPTNPNQWGRIFERGTETDGQQSWMVNQNGTSNDATVRVDTNPGGQYNQNIAIGGPAVYDSTWHHTVFTLNNGNWQKYVDGASAGSGAYNAGSGLGNTQPFYMGGAGNNSQYGGQLDDVAVWNSQISPIELGKLTTNAITPLQVSDAKVASYKIVAYNGDGTQAGNTTFSAYLSDLRGGVGSTGIQFATGSGTNTASATGSVPIRLATSANPADPGYAPDRLHVQALLNFGTPDPTILDPRYYLAAQLTAPPGYVFEFLSGAATAKSQYFTSLGYKSATPPGTDWTASPNSWEDQAGSGVSTRPYTVPVSSSSLAGGPWAPATEGIWARQNPTTVYDNIYFDAPLRMIPGTWDAVGTPVASISNPQLGLSAQLARTTTSLNITSLDQATTALPANVFNLRPGDPGHYMSEVTSILTARIQSAGYGTADRVLAGYQATADGLPSNTAVKLAGYVYIDPAWDTDPGPAFSYIRSFAAGANDGARVWIGDTLIADNSGAVGGAITHTAVPLKFSQSGYWPVTAQWFQNNGTDANMGLAVSSAAGNITTWDSTTFKVLGTDPTFPVWQRPDAVANPALTTGPGLVGRYYSSGFATGILTDYTALNTWLNSRTPGATLYLNQAIDFPVGGGNDSTNDNPFGAIGVNLGTDNLVGAWKGKINITTPGSYTFYTASDDGSALYIGSQLVVNNDFYQGVTERSGTYTFGSAGLYDFMVAYYEGGGGAGVTASWLPPGGSKELIPGSAFNYQLGAVGPNSVGNPLGNQEVLTPPVIVDPSKVGLRVQQASVPAANANLAGAISYFADKTINNGNTTAFNVGSVAVRSNLNMADPTNPGNGNWTPNNAFPNDTAADDNNFVTRMNGVVYIPQAGNYAFSCGTDESFQLRVGSIQLGKYDGNRTVPSGQANIMYGYFPKAGYYPLEFYSHEATGASGIELGNGGFGIGRIQSQFLSSNNPNPAFSVEWGTNAFAVEPVGMLRRDSTGLMLQAQAFANVPALGIALPPEHWVLSKVAQTGTFQGLLGSYYNSVAGLPGTLLGQRLDLNPNPIIGGQSTYQNNRFQFGGGYAHGPWGNTDDNFYVQWNGFITVPNNGPSGSQVYNFHMGSDDNSWIFIDINGDGDFNEPNEAAAGNGGWWVNDYELTLSPGRHAIQLAAREYTGGESSELWWTNGTGVRGGADNAAWAAANYVPDSAFSWDGTLYTTLAEGSGMIGDLLSYGDLMAFLPDWNAQYSLRLQVDVAGLTAFFDGTFTFMPEPTSLVLLGGGLLALARRRRKNAR